MQFYRTFPLARLAILHEAHFPPIFRALIILANGKTVEQMAKILGKEPYDLGVVLRILKDMQMIDMRPPYKRRPLAAAEGRHDTQAYGSTLAGRQTRKLNAA